MIDGADETQLAGWDLGEALLPANPPEGLSILVTARALVGDKAAEGWRRRLGWQAPTTAVTEITLGKLALKEVRGLLEKEIGPALSRTPAFSALCDHIFRLSEKGDPLLVELYVNDVLEALRKGTLTLESSVRALSQRKSGLGPYFEAWIEEQQQAFERSVPSGSVSFEVVEATLVILATALGPVRYGDLSELLRRVLPGQHIPGKSILLAPLARFVIGDDSDGGPGYTLGHPLFGSFLVENQYEGTPLLDRCRQSFLSWGEEVSTELEKAKRAADWVGAWSAGLRVLALGASGVSKALAQRLASQLSTWRRGFTTAC